MTFLAAETEVSALTGVDLLLEMLLWKRPANSRTERLFVETFVATTGAQPDDYGNYWLDVGDNPTILFSSHTDTVHHTEGMQEVQISPEGMITAVVKRVPRKRTQKETEDDLRTYFETGLMPQVPTSLNTNCLGADCTTGVWLMIEMIRANVPGRYVFHRDEEVGGMGSSHVAKHQPELLAGIQFAIAFDRKGYTSIITEQMYGVCCSKAFVRSLGEALGEDLELRDDPTGTFTDTANYTDIIPECTNLSVGYFDQHGPKESQDMHFAELLLQRLIAADWGKLVAKRDPKAYRYDNWDHHPYGGTGASNSSRYGGWRGYEEEEEDDGGWGKSSSSGRRSQNYSSFDPEFGDAIDLISDNPVAIAEYLFKCGFDLADLEEAVKESELQ